MSNNFRIYNVNTRPFIHWKWQVTQVSIPVQQKPHQVVESQGLLHRILAQQLEVWRKSSTYYKLCHEHDHDNDCNSVYWYSHKYSPSNVIVCWHHCYSNSFGVCDCTLHTISISYTGIKKQFSCLCVYSLHVVLLRTVVYEEPYDWAVSRLPQTEPVIEQCPAYGVLTKIKW